ncbi:MAG: ATP synthase F1 subunit delta [Acidimicrobiales bacterium]
MSDRIDGYANALLAVARAEGSVDGTRAELIDVARAVAANDELRSSLSNNLLPAAVRGQIVDDILANKTSNTTRALVGMIVSAGRGGELGAIVESFANQSAQGGSRSAVVRSAVPLTDDQRRRLTSALSARAGGPVELQTIIDPTVVGGAVTTMGDTVIDGSLRNRLNQMRDAV